ncbi:DRTGG domain-containing protein [Cohnella silvisoli]|uniref:DRTGG domain-containing protein n=1 Tax=Cohnella silvisoli TaxID=2873699 RepID=A0ABV1L185_9BACL|nr:DRTGG domain-containing protein [Cohnella silvisoli]MCD9025155.1 CBS domain-containing protein [Cohnella silvisoli]
MDAQELTTKHEQIIQHIENLEVGSRISVRKIAQALEVSDGTAYRAIKEAENRGIVSTRERTGTVRIEKKEPQRIDKLTFAEIAGMVDGQVLGGASGLQKTLNKFVIGAMQLEAMIRYIEPGNLLIVGNRNKAHQSALTLGAGVLITGGFGTTPEVRRLADELGLPVISCKYDTFTVAALINRALSDRLIKKQILLVGDIMKADALPSSIHASETVASLKKLIEATNHNRFPVVDDAGRPVGMIIAKDIIGEPDNQKIEKLMTRNPHTVTSHTSIATASHMMVWEGIELLPVVDAGKTLIGVISRKDVLKAMQTVQSQPQIGETLEDQIWSAFEEVRNERGQLHFRGPVASQMINQMGYISEGLLGGLITLAVTRTMKEHKKGDLLIDSTATYYFAPVEIDSLVEIVPAVIELSRRFCKLEVDVFVKQKKVIKSIVAARVLD